MTEKLLCEGIAEKRHQAELAAQDRVARLEGRVDVLLTRLEFLARDMVTKDILEQLEDDIMAAVDAKLQHICEHFDTEIGRHSDDIRKEVKAAVIGGVRLMARNQRKASARQVRAAEKARDRIIHFGLMFAAIMMALVSGGGAELAKLFARMAASF